MGTARPLPGILHVRLARPLLLLTEIEGLQLRRHSAKQGQRGVRGSGRQRETQHVELKRQVGRKSHRWQRWDSGLSGSQRKQSSRPRGSFASRAGGRRTEPALNKGASPLDVARIDGVCECDGFRDDNSRDPDRHHVLACDNDSDRHRDKRALGLLDDLRSYKPSAQD